MTGNNGSQKIKILLQHWKSSTSFSMAVTILFVLYNGYLGLSRTSGWHCSIAIFYLFLIAVRRTFLLAKRKSQAQTEQQQTLQKRKTCRNSCVLLLLLDVSLIVPISMMDLMQKPVHMDMISAIALAAYTTYKIIAASVHLRPSASRSNALHTQLRAINLIDALVSVLTLQNTLIMVNQPPSEAKNMLPLTAATSALIYIAIIFTSVFALIPSRKNP